MASRLACSVLRALAWVGRVGAEAVCVRECHGDWCLSLFAVERVLF